MHCASTTAGRTHDKPSKTSQPCQALEAEPYELAPFLKITQKVTALGGKATVSISPNLEALL
jgi:hypothetical protein